MRTAADPPPVGGRTGLDDLPAPELDRSDPPRWSRILLKLSGEAFADPAVGRGISPTVVASYADQVAELRSRGVQVACVVGGGNFWRGLSDAAAGMDRATADNMGMLATVINALALQDALERVGVPTRVQSAITMQEVAEPFVRRRAIRHLDLGRVVIFAAGTGNPFFTTDSAAALRAVEIGAELLLKATKVDGVYDADPKKKKDARRFEHLSYDEVISRDLQVMDTAAIALCRDYNLPLRIYDITRPGDLKRIVQGKAIGTLVHGRS